MRNLRKQAAGLPLLLALAGPLAGHAQATPADTSAVAAALAATRQAVPAPLARLLSGIEYVNYSTPGGEGNQFYNSAVAQAGTVRYDGSTFEQVPLRYDLRLDQLVLPDPARNVEMQLIGERVAGFTLAGHRFERLVPPPASGLPAGFYDVLAAGRTRLLARRTKREVQEPGQGHLTFVYRETTRLYVQQDGNFTEVNNLKTLLRALPDQADALRRYADSRRLRFREAEREASAAALVSYYNTLARP